MVDRTEAEIQKVGGAFLAQYTEEDKSLTDMGQFVVVPRFKLIQGMTDKNLKDQFGEGSVIVRPGDTLVWKDGDDPFEFIPLLFYSEWCTWSDLNDTEQPNIVARSFDPTCDIAKKSSDPDKRYEVYEGQEDKKNPQQYAHVHHFVFPGLISGDHPLAGTQVMMSFERGEWSQGRQFISACKLRKVRLDDGTMVPVPLWAQRWAFKGGFRENGNNKWYGLDFQPATQPTIDEADAPDLRAAHLELERLHAENRLMVDHGDETGGDTEKPGDKTEF